MENKICLCCLEKINTEEQSGDSSYHLVCRTQMVVSKAHTFAAGLKLMSVEDIIKNVIVNNSCAEKFTEEEKQILSDSNGISQMVKSMDNFSYGPSSSATLLNQTNQPNQPNPINQTSPYEMLSSKLKNDILSNGDILNTMYESMAAESENFSGLFSKNDFEHVISSSLNLIMNDSSAYEEIMHLSMDGSIDSGKVKPSDSIVQKLIASWPQDLKDKFDLLTKDTTSSFTFNANANSDTETESEDSEIAIEEVD